MSDIAHEPSRDAMALNGEGPGSKSGLNPQSWLPLLGVIVGVALIAGPILCGLVRSLLVWHDDAISVSLANFSGLLGDARFYIAIGNTLLCGIATTALSLALGIALAWIVARTDVPGRRWFETLNLVPFFMSPYVGAIGWTFLIAPYSGLLQNAVKDLFHVDVVWLNIYSRGGVIWVLSLFYTPYVYLLVISPLRQMDGALEDAARVHGASFWTTMRAVTLPLIEPAILSAAMIVFITSAGLFDVPLALTATKGIRMVPTEIFSLVNYPSDLGRASAYGIMIVTVTIGLTLLQRRHLSRRRHTIVTGKGYRARSVQLSRRGTAIALAIECLYVGTGVVLPVLALIAVAVSPLWTGRFHFAAATLTNFHYVLFDYTMTQNALINSLILAVVGAFIGVSLSFLQAYFLERVRSGWRFVADILLSLPLGIPGIVLSLFFLVLAIRTPFYGTLAIMLIAYVARFFPFSTRTVGAMMAALHPELEEAARASGASWAQTIWLIVLPLARPALIAAWIMLFVIFIRELGASILLYSSGTETLSVAMVLLSENSAGYVAALALVQLVLLLGAFVALRLTKAEIV
jgi:iron(III) transport system permease protein